MVQDNWTAFEKRAKLMTGIHASRVRVASILDISCGGLIAGVQDGPPPEFEDTSHANHLSACAGTDPLIVSLGDPFSSSAKAPSTSASTSVPAPVHRRSPSPQLAPPPLQGSAQTNSARSSVPPPSKDEKEKMKAKEGDKEKPTTEGMKKTSMGSKTTGGVTKGVKRPASAMNSGSKEGNVDKRKRGLKRL